MRRLCTTAVLSFLIVSSGCGMHEPKAGYPLPNIPDQTSNHSSSTSATPAEVRSNSTVHNGTTWPIRSHMTKHMEKHAQESKERETKKFKFSFRTEQQQQQQQSNQLKQYRRVQQTQKHLQTKQNQQQQKARSAVSNQKQIIGQRKLSIAQLRTRYPHIFKLRASNSTHEKKIALTFDDVPDNRVTPLVLDILRDEGIRATFFLVGYRAKQYPALVKRIVAEGHVIGNHTYSHPLLTRSGIEAFISQLKQTEAIVDDIVGYKPRFFRPPFGEISEDQLQWAGENGYMVVNWDVDSNDWRGIPSSLMERNILNEVSAGSIVLQHAGGSGMNGYLQNTVKALPSIIKKLRAQNYNFVTVPELFHDQKEKKER
ncbi:polysaccharide deacetylase family protein [Paenibacillus sp. ACRRX]|uniref:polysaccharide deacetylase family protein n=1 Tax=unclassified Paenibacillus TaxID=185978 RepID=UPI001EF54EBA|nr:MULTISPECIES: polysaccharide deacetylase family protein [unclassified Paenibacillus]MCG7409330.1 polysaccharide deacetylase family protein [Paenibacillus sp. ACRRX]MDK8179988.1 polysaccharide deacetylase family protein [Paenibacillus sp. UMB4589-SE434]